jgi:hypothetical protein
MKRFIKGTMPDLPYRLARKKPIPMRCIQMSEPFEVETLEGVMRGNAGDWLMVGFEGEMWPIKKEIFEKTYEFLDSED